METAKPTSWGNASLIGAFLQVTEQKLNEQKLVLVTTEFTKGPLLKLIRVQIPTIVLNILAECICNSSIHILVLKSEKKLLLSWRKSKTTRRLSRL